MTLSLLPRMSLAEVLAAPENDRYFCLVSFLPEATAEEIAQLVAARKDPLEGKLDDAWWDLIFQRWTMVDAQAAEAFAGNHEDLRPIFESAMAAADPSQVERLLAGASESTAFDLVRSQIKRLMEVNPSAAADLFRRWREDPRAGKGGLMQALYAICLTDPELALRLVREELSQTLQHEMLAGLFDNLQDDPVWQAKMVAVYSKLSPAEQWVVIKNGRESDWRNFDSGYLEGLAAHTQNASARAELKRSQLARRMMEQPENGDEWLSGLSQLERQSILSEAARSGEAGSVFIPKLAELWKNGVVQLADLYQCRCHDLARLLPHLPAQQALKLAVEVSLMGRGDDESLGRSLAKVILATDRDRALKVMQQLATWNPDLAAGFYGEASARGVGIQELGETGKHLPPRALAEFWCNSGPAQREALGAIVRDLDDDGKSAFSKAMFPEDPSPFSRTYWESWKAAGNVAFEVRDLIPVPWDEIAVALMKFNAKEIPGMAQQLRADELAGVAPTLTDAWLKEDSMAASSWVRELPPGPARDSAAARIISYLSADNAKVGPEDAAAAIIWLNEIRTPEKQMEAARMMKDAVRENDSASLREAAARLPESVRQTLWP